MKEKIAIVTGASSGIGRATALRFAREGASVLAEARNREALDTLRESEPAIAAFADDVSADDAPSEIVAAAVETFGGLDALVNAAGIIGFGTAESTSDGGYLLHGSDVLFNTVGASSQEYPVGSGESFSGKIVPAVRLDGGGATGDARLLSFGLGVEIGHDAIHCTFGAPVRAAAVQVEGNTVDFTLELYWEDGSLMALVPAPAAAGGFFGVSAAIPGGEAAIGGRRVVPGVSAAGETPNTPLWSLNAAWLAR